MTRKNITAEYLASRGYRPDFGSSGVHSIDDMVDALRRGDRYMVGYFFSRGAGDRFNGRGYCYISAVDEDNYETAYLVRDLLPHETASWAFDNSGYRGFLHSTTIDRYESNYVR